MDIVTLFCITFSVLTKIDCNLFKSIGCSHTVYKYWMQHCCLFTKCFQCDQLTYNSNNGFRHTCRKTECKCWMQKIIASNGCSLNFCIQSVLSSCNYWNKAKKKYRHTCSQTEYLQVLNADNILPLINR